MSLKVSESKIRQTVLTHLIAVNQCWRQTADIKGAMPHLVVSLVVDEEKMRPGQSFGSIH